MKVEHSQLIPQKLTENLEILTVLCYQFVFFCIICALTSFGVLYITNIGICFRSDSV